MYGKQQKKETVFNKQDVPQMEELKAQINNLPKDNPKACEGLIRELYKKISEISKESAKEQLYSDLKAVSCRGVNGELKKMVEDNGLNMEALHLVLKYLTTKEELGEYFFTNPKGDGKDGLDAVRRRLGPKLEVLGGLYTKGIDVTKNWVKNLVKEAPSMQSLSRISVGELKELCKADSHGETEVVKRLVKIAESRSRQKAAAQDVQEFDEKEGGEKSIDPEKLKEAKALMNEAKKMAKDQSDEAKKAVNEKLAEITKILQLPQDWNKQDIGLKPEQLFEQLDGIIDQFNSVVEVGEAYKSELEVVRKASGGRALCGIYHSEYVPPLTAEVPIIVMPNKLILSSPNNSQQVRYVKFSKSRAATNYVHSVKSSSSNIGLGIGGFYDLVVGEFSGSYATRSDKEKTTSEKMQTSSASVVQYIWIATKTFKIEQEQLKLSASARKMASTVVKDTKTARLFMQRYGSHFPAGLHTLGGVLFRIVDAESSSTKATTVLAEKAAQKLQGQISVGFLGGLYGIGGSISGEKSSGSGKEEGHDEVTDDVSYTFSSQAMGPATTNPATFNKLLANNSTWAIIDRGGPNAYIPIWELIRDIGCEFEGAAEILKDTWDNDEAERKPKTKEKDIKKILFDIRTAPKREKVYADHGTGAKKGICVFQATLNEIPEGYHIIGQVAVGQTESVDVPQSSLILVKPSDLDLIRQPECYELKWNDIDSGGKMNGSFWRVVAPKGYVALGDVVTNNYSEPPSAFTAKYACIREDLLVPGMLNPTVLWDDKGSGAKKNGSVWQVEGPGVAGLFKIEKGYKQPDIPVFVLPAKLIPE